LVELAGGPEEVKQLVEDIIDHYWPNKEYNDLVTKVGELFEDEQIQKSGLRARMVRICLSSFSTKEASEISSYSRRQILNIRKDREEPTNTNLINLKSLLLDEVVEREIDFFEKHECFETPNGRFEHN
jgi:hypothetical protein